HIAQHLLHLRRSLRSLLPRQLQFCQNQHILHRLLIDSTAHSLRLLLTVSAFPCLSGTGIPPARCPPPAAAPSAAPGRSPGRRGAACRTGTPPGIPPCPHPSCPWPPSYP